MSGARAFTELECWRRARQWSKAIFQATRDRPFSDDHRLLAQINDSSASVMANIAEGFGRGTQNEFILFLGYALGSLDETKSHLCAAYDRDYLTKAQFGVMFAEGTEIRKITVAFLRSMIMPRGGVRALGTKRNLSADAWELYERVTGKPRPERFTKKDDDVKPDHDDEPPL